LDSSEQPLQSSASVAWEGRPEIPPFGPQQYPGHTSNTLASSSTTTNQPHSSGTPWPIVESGEASIGPPRFQRVQDEDTQWNVGQAQPDHGSYTNQPRFHQSVASSAFVQAPQRPSTRRKIAKVPSSFVERQEKLKVSKRKGPLQEKQREKTHTMRKTKRICVRCRFYKSGVSNSHLKQIQS
jgi:hypothetical protein